MYRYSYYPYNIAETFLSEKKYLDFFANDKLDPHHFYIDKNFKITSCCEHLSKILSYDNSPMDELFGLDSRLLFKSDIHIDNALRKLRFRPNEQIAQELKLKRKDGTEFWVFMLFRYENHMISGQRTLLCQYININKYKRYELEYSKPISEHKSKSMNQTKILFLGINPKNTKRLRLDEEAKLIEEGLKRSKGREGIEFITKWAVQTDDIRRHFLDVEPNIVHISGHGNTNGIAFENEIGNVQQLPFIAVDELFRLFSDSIRCVILNTCDSIVHIEGIAKHIDTVIGMNRKIPDDVAIKFSVAFYDAIGAGRDYDFAFEMGKNAIQMHNIEASDIPVLYKKMLV